MDKLEQERFRAIKDRLLIAGRPEQTEERIEAQKRLLFSDISWLIWQLEKRLQCLKE
jgi:hypothetical protein